MGFEVLGLGFRVWEASRLEFKEESLKGKIPVLKVMMICIQ